MGTYDKMLDDLKEKQRVDKEKAPARAIPEPKETEKKTRTYKKVKKNDNKK